MASTFKIIRSRSQKQELERVPKFLCMPIFHKPGLNKIFPSQVTSTYC